MSKKSIEFRSVSLSGGDVYEVHAWMLYVLVITLLLSGAALAAERAARCRRARMRWIWAVTTVASLSIQASTPTVARRVVALRDLTSVQVVPLTWVHEHTRNMVCGAYRK